MLWKEGWFRETPIMQKEEQDQQGVRRSMVYFEIFMMRLDSAHREDGILNFVYSQKDRLGGK